MKLTIEQQQNRARKLLHHCGIRKEYLEREKIYFMHEFTNDQKTGVYLVQFQGKDENGNFNFIKLDHEGKHDMVWKDNENPYLCNVWNSGPNVQHATIINKK